jgi:hypothetical protein
MLTHRLVQALLLAVTATVALPGSVSFVQAAEECRSKPGPTASSGSRWLYQINRTDHRHCWFLSSKAVSTQSQSSRRYRHLAGESDAVRQDQQGGSDLKARSAPASETDVAEAAEPPTAPQIAAPSVGYGRKILLRTAFRPLFTNCHHPVDKIWTSALITVVFLRYG